MREARLDAVARSVGRGRGLLRRLGRRAPPRALILPGDLRDRGDDVWKALRF